LSEQAKSHCQLAATCGLQIQLGSDGRAENNKKRINQNAHYLAEQRCEAAILKERARMARA